MKTTNIRKRENLGREELVKVTAGNEVKGESVYTFESTCLNKNVSPICVAFG
jgi:hypothetical protein